MEMDMSNYAIRAYISQLDEKEKLCLVAFFSHKMSLVELNYNIYDKELLAIMKVFKEWRVYLEGVTLLVKVLIDHKNLLYFTTTK
jgi:hypothetical protein